MNRKWACTLLGGSLLLMGHGGGLSVETIRLPDTSSAFTNTAVHALAQSPLGRGSADSAAPDSGQQPDAAIALRDVNGITLSDDREAVVAKLGVPEDIIQDPLNKDLEIYRYAQMEVSFSGDHVYDVSVSADSGSLTLDGVKLQIAPASIRDKLGDPDYVAEDGLVYQRGYYLLKVYLNVEQGRIDVIRYYSLANT
ncbi:hypothetical protein [Gorillibacterium timonense]|uniref:hypothetical protein n=1 Tax=Gorillibacterium timonense TaxID=1689269 RepID=UPI00071C450F|nr:hypothetical protein [Gorillibacterium timonense]